MSCSTSSRRSSTSSVFSAASSCSASACSARSRSEARRWASWATRPVEADQQTRDVTITKARRREGTKLESQSPPSRQPAIVNCPRTCNHQLQSAIRNRQSAMNCYHPHRAGARHRLRRAAGWPGGQRRDGPAGAAAEDPGPRARLPASAALVEAVLATSPTCRVMTSRWPRSSSACRGASTDRPTTRRRRSRRS